MRFGNALIVALCLALTCVAAGQRRMLSVGDPAPGLDIEAWVEGEEVVIETGGVYVVVFWESVSSGGQAVSRTLKSLVHLRDLYEAYSDKGLVVLAISTETPDRLRQYIGQVRQGLGFTVAADRRNSTKRAWFQAAGLKEMPAAFIVGRNGNIMHIGEPLDEQFDKILERVIRDRYDPVLIEQAEPMLRAARRARKVKNWRMAAMHFDKTIALDARVFADVALERFEMMIVDMAEPETAYGYAREVLMGQLFRSDAGALRDLAAKIAVDPKIDREHRDLEVALEAANRAQQVAGRDEPESLATLALVRFHMGDVEGAVELQTQAYFAARPRAKAGYKRVLVSYQEAAERSPSGAGAG